nr:hypothetical protein [uncultured Pseudomonas sp.]
MLKQPNQSPVEPESLQPPEKPAKHPVTAASEPTPVELSPLEQLLAQMGPRHVEFVWQGLVRLNAIKAYQAAFEVLLPVPQDRMEHRRQIAQFEPALVEPLTDLGALGYRSPNDYAKGLKRTP